MKQRYTRALYVLLTWFCCFALGLAATQAQDDPTQNPGLAEGTAEDSVYRVSDLDSVNLYNGNLTLNVPLGATYPVGGSLSYGLQLVYNSGAAWAEEFKDEARCQPGAGNPNVDFTIHHASKLTNAGLGWTVSLGRLIPPNLNRSTQLYMKRWTYIQPDGHRRGFYDTLHDGVGAAGNTKYSNDGSYIRMRLNAAGCENSPVGGATCHVLEFPDGTYHEMHEVDSQPGFRPTYMADRFGNWVKIDYSTSTWLIEDKHGRQQRVEWETGQNGLPRVNQIELTSFGDTPSNPGAVYDFTYASQTVARHQLEHYDTELNCVQPPYYIGNSSTAVEATLSVDMLSSLTLPDGSYYDMSYYGADGFGDVAPGGRSASIQSLRLPTAAEYTWEYNGRYGMRVANRVDVAVLKPGDRVLGVARKRRYENSTLTGVWQYDHGFSIYNSELDPFAETGNVPCYHKTDVRFFDEEPNANTDPLLWDRYFFSSARNTWKEFHGMGFTPCIPDVPAGTNYNGPALSQQSFDGSGQLLRETYVLYDRESTATNSHGSLYERNFRLRQQVIEYHDDKDSSGNPHWIRHTWGYDDNLANLPSDYDGRGHFRTYRLDSNFPLGRHDKEVYQRYGVKADDTLSTLSDAPALTDPWVLNNYDETRVTEGTGATHQARTLYCFNADTGFLEGHRAIKNGGPGPGDIVVRFDESSGNPTRERYYGGDFTDVGGDGRCEVDISAAYDTHHTYQAGVRRKTEHKNGSTVVLRSLDTDIDVASGLVKTSRDASGIATDYVYDSMGRVTQEKPAIRAYTIHEYRFPTSSGPNRALEHNTRQCANGALNCSGSGALKEQLLDYDRLGRMVKERNRVPGIDGTGSRLVERTFTYDALSRLVARTDWRDPSISGYNFTTEYNDLDRFGRVGQIAMPDGSTTTLTYTGDRLLERTVKIHNGTAQVDATVEEARDAKGRLVWVSEPSGTNGGRVDTTYEYDEGDRLIKACLNDGDQIGDNVCSGQQRKYDYDDRGLLTQEEHPELGRANNTDRWIRYFYDARRNMVVRSLSGSGLDRNYAYDNAGRVTQVMLPEEVGGGLGDRLLQEYFYRPTGTCGGLLDQSKQHNRVPVPGSQGVDRDIVVTETFVYDAADACRLSTYGVRASHGDDFRAASFATSYSYNDLDDVVALEYPDCGAPGCSGTPAQISYQVPYGALTAVGNVAGLTYNATGQVHKINHTNGVLDTYERSASTWKPLHSITVSGLTGRADWTYGPFHFDGAQNIYRIETSSGDESFGYDKVGRLVTSSVRSTAGLKQQDLTYDVFGNLTEIDSTDTPLMAIPVDSGRNRLSGLGATYDVAGNVTALTLGSGSYTYRRDGMSLLSRLSGGGVDRSHLYTAGAERLASLDLLSGEEEWTPRDLGSRVLSRFRRQDGLAFEWSQDYMHAGSRQIATAQPDGLGGERLRHFHLDHLGSTRLITDANGQVVTENTFYPFGAYTTGAIEGSEALQFTGHERDDLGGNDAGHLDYMHARYYTPQVGRFLAIDPADDSIVPEMPQSWNRYTYAMNNPMRYRDPDGEAIETPWDALNVGLGLASLTANIASGNVGGALLDAAGLVYDTTATAVPGLPGGAGTLIKASRARKLLSAADDVLEAGLKNAPVPKACFPAGTLVWTFEGQVAIEAIEPGQLVACANAIEETWSYCVVENRLEHHFEGQVVTLTVAEEVLQATANHPFWVTEGRNLETRPLAEDAGLDALRTEGQGRWVEAQHIELDDYLLLADGRRVSVERTGSFTTSIPVFNLQVGERRTYAVGKLGILVHNKAAVRTQQGTVKSVEEAADEVADLAGRNRVSARTSDSQVDIDLRGKGHFDKPSGQRIETPHVHESKLNVGANGKVSASDKTTRPATMEDVRNARKILERRRQ